MNNSTIVNQCSLFLNPFYLVNKKLDKFLLILIIPLTFTTKSFSQEIIKYTGTILSNIDYHHGQLQPVIGVHNIQVVRANREYPDSADGYGWTYNHAPMLVYWNNTFFLEYLSDSVGEHIPPGQTFLATSKNGYDWNKPVVVFPQYKIPDGTTKEGVEGVAKDLIAVNHQRMGFYVSKDNRLLVLAFYGISLNAKDSPNDGKGIGRVVREIYKDGSFGPIYFIRYNHGWNEGNTSFPNYKKSKDKGFVKACDELLSVPLMMQQWVEEADRDDPLIPLKKEYKAFSWYHLQDGRVVGLWKHALTSISEDNGKTWLYEAKRAPGFVNGNAKIWGQKTSDGKYVTVYNPSEFRWPLALSVSDNGLEYKNLLLVNGEVSTMRYGGNYKSYGPQYVRGITEGNGTPEDGNLWVTYSMNKEDIWVSEIPIPVEDKVVNDINETFNELPNGEELRFWNIFSPKWAPVYIQSLQGEKYLSLSDWDHYDFAKAERVIPAAKKMIAEFTIVPQQNDHGMLQVEFQDATGLGTIRLIFDESGKIMVKAGYRYSGITEYNAGEEYRIKVELNLETRIYEVTINDSVKKKQIIYAPVQAVERIVFRTGDIRRFPDADTPTDQDFDVEKGGKPDLKAVFLIKSLKTKKN
ncbi:MAG: hypothetical protein JXB49_21410 [Bacteroidales bacterium]|nr:hypothetical protein [Bacteroidales bacterium]